MQASFLHLCYPVVEKSLIFKIGGVFRLSRGHGLRIFTGGEPPARIISSSSLMNTQCKYPRTATACKKRFYDSLHEWFTEPDKEMEKMEKTKKRQKAHRGVVTKLVNKVDTHFTEDPEALYHGKLQQLATELREKKVILKDLDDAILDLMMEESLDDENCEKEAAEANKVIEKIGICLNSIDNALKTVISSNLLLLI